MDFHLITRQIHILKRFHLENKILGGGPEIQKMLLKGKNIPTPESKDFALSR